MVLSPNWSGLLDLMTQYTYLPLCAPSGETTPVRAICSASPAGGALRSARCCLPDARVVARTLRAGFLVFERRAATGRAAFLRRPALDDLAMRCSFTAAADVRRGLEQAPHLIDERVGQ